MIRYEYENSVDYSSPGIVIPEWTHDYPEQFRNLHGGSVPETLFCLGNTALLKKQSIMVCGSRNASETSIELAYQCGRLIGERGYVCASGYARGVDSAAHLGALEAGGSTIAIIPYGLRRFRIHHLLKDAFDPSRFLVVSENPPLAHFTTKNALRRNKLLVALSGTVIVVEPGETGGTWFSARYADKMKKPLYFLEGLKPESIPHLESLGGTRISLSDGIPDLSPVWEGEETMPEPSKERYEP
jgi:DNA processing protein